MTIALKNSRLLIALVYMLFVGLVYFQGTHVYMGLVAMGLAALTAKVNFFYLDVFSSLETVKDQREMKVIQFLFLCLETGFLLAPASL